MPLRSFMPANDPWVLFINVVIVAILWMMFSSLNALAVANNPNLGGCCATGECGKAPMDVVMYRGTAVVASIMTLILIISLVMFFTDRIKKD